MADYSFAQITIGGCIPRRIVPRLCRLIGEEGLTVEVGEACFCPQSVEDLLAARQLVDGELVLRFCADEARFGEFDQLESYLLKQGIPFERHSESNFTYSAHLVVFRPQTGRQEWLASSSGQPLVPAAIGWDVLEELQQVTRAVRRTSRQVLQERLQHCLESLRDVLASRPSPLPSFEIGKSVALRHAA